MSEKCLLFSEQDRIVKNFVKESCAIRSGILGNKTCSSGISALSLEVPMVPCNFIPLQSQIYRGKNQWLNVHCIVCFI